MGDGVTSPPGERIKRQRFECSEHGLFIHVTFGELGMFECPLCQQAKIDSLQRTERKYNALRDAVSDFAEFFQQKQEG